MTTEFGFEDISIFDGMSDDDFQLYNGVGDLESSTSLPEKAIVKVINGTLGVFVRVTVRGGTYHFILPNIDYDSFMALLKQMQSDQFELPKLPGKSGRGRPRKIMKEVMGTGLTVF